MFYKLSSLIYNKESIYNRGRRRDMARKGIIGIVVLMSVLLVCGMVSGNTNNQNVHVIPIRGEITSATYHYVKHNLTIAEQDPKAVAVIFEIDTYGGRIDATEKISQLILNTHLHTISFVNTKAESAGVLLTISADNIAMAPTGTIGSAETVPNTEKVLSTWIGILRSVAQERGRDEKIVVAMADRLMHIPGVVDIGRLLNLTTWEAEKLKFTDIVAKDYAEVLNALSIPYTNIVATETTNSIKLAYFVTNPYITPILLTIGFLGFLIEIFTTGFGIAGTISLISFALYFSGNLLAGNTGWASLIIFLVGVVLLAIEAFIPGFGVVGAGGIISIIIGIFMASSSVTSALISLAISLVLTLIILTIILKYAPRNKHFNKIILNTKLDKAKGYTSFDDNSKYLGETGRAVTPLRPSGIISIDEQLLDVVSEGQFIEKGELVKVYKVEGRRIIVQKIN